MTINKKQSWVFGTGLAALLAGSAMAQTGANVEWPQYGADLAASHYRPLDQINAANFSKLEVVWRFKTDNIGNRPEYKLEGTPLEIGGVVYTTAGSRRGVVALDAVTGELIWVHGEKEGARGGAAPRQLSGRGLSYWSDGKEARILYVTPGYRLVALDARTGQPVEGFGAHGIVDLKRDFDQEIRPDLVTGEVGLHATPTVAGNIVLVGAAFREGFTPATWRNNKGYVRAYDARTGKRLWTFHTIPKKGEFGYDTWLNNSADDAGNTGVWNQITVDRDLNLAYLPVESPTGDFYGGHRPGPNLFGESVVAVDLDTGKLKWYYQMVHHPLWDMDASAAPMLMDITVKRKADQGVGAAVQTGLALCAGPRHGQAGLADPGKESRKRQCAGRMVCADAAVPDPAQGLFAQRRFQRRSHRLHARLAGEGAGDGEELQDGAGVLAAGIVHPAQPAGNSHARRRQWRHQLAGRFLQSRKPHGVSLRLQFLFRNHRRGAAAAGPVRHAICRRHRRRPRSRWWARAARAQAPTRQCPRDRRVRPAMATVCAGRWTACRSSSRHTPPSPPSTWIRAISNGRSPHGETPDIVRNNAALKGMTIPRTGQTTYNIGTLVTKTW